MLAFSLMTNNYVGPVEALRSLQDRLCIELVNLWINALRNCPKSS